MLSIIIIIIILRSLFPMPYFRCRYWLVTWAIARLLLMTNHSEHCPTIKRVTITSRRFLKHHVYSFPCTAVFLDTLVRECMSIFCLTCGHYVLVWVALGWQPLIIFRGWSPMRSLIPATRPDGAAHATPSRWQPVCILATMFCRDSTLWWDRYLWNSSFRIGPSVSMAISGMSGPLSVVTLMCTA